MQYKIVEFIELPSTNDQAMAGGYGHGDIILTDCQTAGRGQRGSRWSATPGQNLTFSLVVEPTHVPACEQFTVSEITALAASDALLSYGVDCRLKWPNDLYVNDMKIGGILIEHTSMGEFLSRSVLGVGLNVGQREFPVDVPNPTSLSLLGVESSPSELLQRFEEAFDKRYAQEASELHRDFMSRLWRSEGYFRYRDFDGEFTARIANVDAATGQLTLQDKHGVLREYWFKEVEATI